VERVPALAQRDGLVTKKGFVQMLNIMLLELFGGCALLALVWRHQQLYGTTLMAAWYWSVLAILSIMIVETLVNLRADWLSPSRIGPLRYLAAILTACPIVALLGAKRPQHRAWQWIVLSLWVVLAMPAATALFFSQPTFDPGILWSWFLLILVVMTSTNYLPTCYWPAGLLVGTSQIFLLSNQLPGGRHLVRWLDPHSSHWIATAALALLLLAVIFVQWISRARRAWNPNLVTPLDRIWRDFRDSYGALWGLRIVDRLNSAAKSHRGNIYLRWNGFRHSGDGSTDTAGNPPGMPLEITMPLEQIFVSLLRRFVSIEWIDQRRTPPLEKPLKQSRK